MVSPATARHTRPAPRKRPLAGLYYAVVVKFLVDDFEAGWKLAEEGLNALAGIFLIRTSTRACRRAPGVFDNVFD